MKNIIFYFLLFSLFAPQVGIILRVQKRKMIVVGSCHITAPAAIKITNSHPVLFPKSDLFSAVMLKDFFGTDIVLNERVCLPYCIFSMHVYLSLTIFLPFPTYICADLGI